MRISTLYARQIDGQPAASFVCAGPVATLADPVRVALPPLVASLTVDGCRAPSLADTRLVAMPNKLFRAALPPLVAVSTVLATEAASAPDAVLSGLVQAVALVGASELGDKTFFLSMIIAMREGRSVAFAGSMSALGVLTAASVGAGQAMSHASDLFTTSLPVGDIVALGMFTYFGLQMLRDARLAAAGTAGGEAMREAEEELAERDRKGGERGGEAVAKRLWLPAFITAFSLVFVAEVGDKSMFATIILAREYSASGVMIGSMIGHTMATGLAVVGGAALTKYMSEATIGYVAGVLFLAFAVATLASIVFREADNEGDVVAKVG